MTVYATTTAAIAAIETHPACASFQQLPSAFIATYPLGSFPSGIAQQRGPLISDLAALNRLIMQLDNWAAAHPKR